MIRSSIVRILCIVVIIPVCFLTTAHATEPNDSFGEATVLSPGVLSVSDSLEGMSPFPDTFLGFFADDTFTPPPVAEDDDSSPLGNGFADALFGIDINSDGSVPLAVTGCCDSFDGSHVQEGDYELFVEIFDPAGALIDQVSTASTLMPGVIDEFYLFDPTWIGGTFDAIIDNVSATPASDPLDFWVFTGLIPSVTYTAEIIAGNLDTILAQFDSSGTQLAIDDDGGDGLLSLLDVTANADGELYLAVTGFDDFGVNGSHFEAGSYQLVVSVPEPSTLAIILLSLASLAGYRRISA